MKRRLCRITIITSCLLISFWICRGLKIPPLMRFLYPLSRLEPVAAEFREKLEPDGMTVNLDGEAKPGYFSRSIIVTTSDNIQYHYWVRNEILDVSLYLGEAVVTLPGIAEVSIRPYIYDNVRVDYDMENRLMRSTLFFKQGDFSQPIVQEGEPSESIQYYYQELCEFYDVNQINDVLDRGERLLEAVGYGD